MSRTRYLKPDFFLDEELAELRIETRMLFAGLWTIADRAGRLEDRPKRIKAQIFPWDEVDVNAMLTELEVGRFIQRYEANGKRYIQIRNFEKHQRPHIKEAASLIPEPPEPIKEPASTGKAGARTGIMGTGMGMGMGMIVPEPGKAPAGIELKAKPDDGNDKKLARSLKGLILRNDGKTKTPRSLDAWTKEAGRLLRIDERPFAEAVEVMQYALTDEFWQSNILSMGKFRKQYDRLRLRLKEKRNGARATRCQVCRAHPARAESPICAVCAYCRHCGGVRGPWRLFQRTDRTKTVACEACVKGGRLKRERDPDEHEKQRGGLKPAAGAIPAGLRGERRG